MGIVISVNKGCAKKEHIKSAEMSYSYENTMYGTLGPERTVWDEEADEAMRSV